MSDAGKVQEYLTRRATFIEQSGILKSIRERHKNGSYKTNLVSTFNSASARVPLAVVCKVCEELIDTYSRELDEIDSRIRAMALLAEPYSDKQNPKETLK